MSTIKCYRMDAGGVPRKAASVRFCKACGKRVSMYKNARSLSVLCYCCEDKLPWTYALIVGGGTWGEMENRTDENHVKTHPTKPEDTTTVVGS